MSACTPSTICAMMQQQTMALIKPGNEYLAEPHTSPHSIDSGYQSRRCSKGSKHLSKRHRDRKTFIQALLQPTDIRSPEAQRLGLQPYFYQQYQGKSGPDYACKATCLEIATYGRSIALAIDTFLFLITGTASNNLALLRQAKVRYILTVKSLRKDLMRISDAPHPFYFMTVVHILQCAEMFECIAEEFSDWRKHMAGLKAIIAAVSTDQHRRGAEQAGWILSKRVKIPFGLWSGLVDLGGQAGDGNVAVDEVDLIEEQSPLDCVYYHVLAVLQHGEEVRLRGRKASVAETADALEELVATEGALHRALKDLYEELEGPAYHTVPIDEDDKKAEDSPAFSHTVEFANIYIALHTAYYWMSLLALRTMHLDIRKAVGKKSFPYEYDFCGLGVKTMTRNAHECANHLCMAHAALANDGYVGMMCSVAPLQLASRWYARQGDDLKLDWCRRAGNALSGRGLMKFDIG